MSQAGNILKSATTPQGQGLVRRSQQRPSSLQSAKDADKRDFTSGVRKGDTKLEHTRSKSADAKSVKSAGLKGNIKASALRASIKSLDDSTEGDLQVQRSHDAVKSGREAKRKLDHYKKLQADKSAQMKSVTEVKGAQVRTGPGQGHTSPASPQTQQASKVSSLQKSRRAQNVRSATSGRTTTAKTVSDQRAALKVQQEMRRMQAHAKAARAMGQKGALKAGASAATSTTSASAAGAKASVAGAKAAASKGGFAALAAGSKGCLVVGGGLGLFIIILLVVAAIFATPPDEIEGLGEVESQIALFLLERDISPLHIAAIMGNIYAESRYNPAAVEAGPPFQGRGLLQWTWWCSHQRQGMTGGGGIAERRQQLYRFTGFDGCVSGQRSSLDRTGAWTCVESQLYFMWAEMTRQGPARAYSSNQWLTGSQEQFLSITDLDQATSYFALRFLRHSALANRDRQHTEAHRIYNLLASGVILGVGEFTWPVPGHTRVSSPFGWRTHPIWGDRRFHAGIDIPAPFHTPVVAANHGTITFRGWMGGYGNTLVIYHGNGVSTLYAHLQNFQALQGQTVIAGQRIATVGSTGDSTGPHLHFEVRINNQPQDPMNFLGR